MHAALALLLGVRLVKAFDPWHGQGCVLTPADMEGPYFQANVPVKAYVCEPEADSVSTRLRVTGRILSGGDGCASAVPGAKLEVWQADDAGEYDNSPAATRCRGSVLADEEGVYTVDTLEPNFYGGRPKHIHVIVTAAGHARLTTQLYFSDDPLSAPGASFLPGFDTGRLFAVRSLATPSTQLASNGAPLLSMPFDIVLEALASPPISTNLHPSPPVPPPSTLAVVDPPIPPPSPPPTTPTPPPPPPPTTPTPPPPPPPTTPTPPPPPLLSTPTPLPEPTAAESADDVDSSATPKSLLPLFVAATICVLGHLG